MRRGAVQQQPVTLAGRTLTLRFSWLAFCVLCDALNATVSTVVEAMQNAAPSDMDDVVHAGLVTTHPDLTREEVRDLMDAAGTYEAMGVVAIASALFFQSLEPEGGGSAANPLKAAVRRLRALIRRLTTF